MEDFVFSSEIEAGSDVCVGPEGDADDVHTLGLGEGYFGIG